MTVLCRSLGGNSARPRRENVGVDRGIWGNGLAHILQTVDTRQQRLVRMAFAVIASHSTYTLCHPSSSTRKFSQVLMRRFIDSSGNQTPVSWLGWRLCRWFCSILNFRQTDCSNSFIGCFRRGQTNALQEITKRAGVNLCLETKKSGTSGSDPIGSNDGPKSNLDNPCHSTGWPTGAKLAGHGTSWAGWSWACSGPSWQPSMTDSPWKNGIFTYPRCSMYGILPAFCLNLW